MVERKLNKEDKQEELVKYQALILATIDYFLDREVMKVKTADFDSDEYFKQMKIDTEEQL